MSRFSTEVKVGIFVLVTIIILAIMALRIGRYELGKEEDISLILKGKEPIPEDMDPRRRNLLIEILEDIHGGIEDSTRARDIQRGSHVRGDVPFRSAEPFGSEPQDELLTAKSGNKPIPRKEVHPL